MYSSLKAQLYKQEQVLRSCSKCIYSATIIEHIRSDIVSQDTALVYFYFDHRDVRKQMFKEFVATAIKQLIKQNVSCLNNVAARFKSAEFESRDGLPDSEYIPLLLSMCQQFKRTIIVLDALDECLQEELEPIIQGLRELLGPSDWSSIQILTTSRHELAIERIILPLATFQMSLMKNIRQDIVAYVNNEIDERISSRRLKLRNRELAKDIKDGLLRHSDGM